MRKPFAAVLAALLALTLALAVAGCGGSQPASESMPPVEETTPPAHEMPADTMTADTTMTE